MKRLIAISIFTILLSFFSFAQKLRDDITYVNLSLQMADGKIGSMYFDFFVAEEETKYGETTEEALGRITYNLYKELRTGLNDKSKGIIYGDFPDAQYNLKVSFIKSNKDGQWGTFRLSISDKNTPQTLEFTKKVRGGTFGSRIHLLSESIGSVGRRSAPILKYFIEKPDKRNKISGHFDGKFVLTDSIK